MLLENNVWKSLARRSLSSFRYLNLTAKVDISYIVERQNWSIRQDGNHISRETLKIDPKLKVRVTHNPFIVKPRILHFGSQFMFENWLHSVNSSNKILVNYFHGKLEDDEIIRRNLNFLIENQEYVSKVIVSFEGMRRRLVDYGINPDLIEKVPIGVSTQTFVPVVDKYEQSQIRERLNIPKNCFVVGSFQKDSQGWGYGKIPKKIKGPDILVNALQEISNSVEVCVLLSGPSRGYVIEKLINYGINFRHLYVKNYEDIVDLYKALDLYIITSREEGGPKGLVEALSVGCPVVTTPVGMANELKVNGAPFFVVNSFNSGEIARVSLSVLTRKTKDSDAALLRNLALPYDWSNVAKTLLLQVYRPLLLK